MQKKKGRKMLLVTFTTDYKYMNLDFKRLNTLPVLLSNEDGDDDDKQKKDENCNIDQCIGRL